MEARRREPEHEHERDRGVRPVERERYGYEARPAGLRGLVNWSSVWVGVIVGFAAFSILGAFVTAIGLTASGGTTAAIWGLVVSFVGFLIGGYVAGMFSSVTGRSEGWVLGSLIWALATAFIMLLAAFGAAGLLSAVTGGLATTGPSPQQVATGTLIALVVVYVGSVIGAIVGVGTREQAEEHR